MIRRVVSAVFLIRDGFTGIPFVSGASVRCVLDGRNLRPLWKPGGYLILTDLAPGEHQLLISCRCFRDMVCSFSVGDAMWEQEVDLEPAGNYPYPQDTALLHLGLKKEGKPAAKETVWAATPGMVSLRFAQIMEKDSTQARLVCRGSVALLSLPGWFLTADKGKSDPELVHLLKIESETGVFDSPAQMKHSRGTELLRARRFITDTDGCLDAAFRCGEPLILLWNNQWKTIDLKTGKQELEWKEG